MNKLLGLLVALLALSLLPRAESEDFTAEIFELYSSQEAKDSLSLEELEAIFADLGIPHVEEDGEGHEDEDDHHDHDHRRGFETRAENHEHDDTESFVPHSPEELLALYNVTHAPPYTQEDFDTISPGIIHELLAKHRASLAETPTQPPPSRAKAWGFSILATFIICLLSLLGLPLSRLAGNRLFLNGLIGLGVGVLVGDAIFHLIPAAYGVHGHNHGGEEESPKDERQPLYISLVLCTGVFFLYVAEHMFHMFTGSSAHSHGHHHHEPPALPQDQEKPVRMSIEDPEKGADQDENGVGQAKRGEKGKATFMGVEFVGWAILLNDSIHNFIDGLAIGSSFSASLLLGWITSLAVLLHELPHEIADFFILVNAGFTVKWALLSNFISSLTALLGCVVGVALGTLNETSTAYVLALTAGFFIYISLATLLPEIDSGGHKLNFLVATAGIFLGFLSMILLAVFEEDLEGLAR